MNGKELDMLAQAVMNRLFVPLEASGRHVHLTHEQTRQLFGHSLTPQRELSQPGQYLARERVRLVGPAGELKNVAVLGPERKHGQAEISLTDGKVLGITPPVRMSGDVAGTPGIRIEGSAGEITLKEGLIAARRHVHLSPAQAKDLGVRDGQTVSLEVYTHRPVTFHGVAVRVHPEFQGAVHLDYDEANACGLKKGDWGRIVP